MSAKSCEDCREMQEHCISVWNNRGVRCDPMPVFKPKWGMCPLVNRVCCFPIDETAPANMRGLDPHRPLFYYELDAKRNIQFCKRKKGATIARRDAEEMRNLESTYEKINKVIEEWQQLLCC